MYLIDGSVLIVMQFFFLLHVYVQRIKSCRALNRKAHLPHFNVRYHIPV